MGIFSAKKTKNQYAKVTTKSKLTLDITESSQWKKCSKCNEIIYNEDLKNNLNVCPKCGNYFPLNAFERIELLIDERTFEEQDITLNSKDFLNFPMYKEKLEESIKCLPCSLNADRMQCGTRQFCKRYRKRKFLRKRYGKQCGR